MTPFEAMLDAALDAVRAGDFDALSGFDPEAALPTLQGADAAALARVRRKAERLSDCLGAAGKGIRAARWRVAEIAAMGRNGDRLVTYDGKGRRAEGGGSGALTQRV